ncbi:MAG: hypothetical protein V1918_00280 [Planctomycetota bacterium]
MDETPHAFEAWAGRTTLHPLGFLAVLVLGLATLLLPRRHAILPLFVMACFIAPAQRIVVFTLDFTLLRVMVLFGWLRLLFRSDHVPIAWKPMDTVLVLWAATGTLAHTLLWGTASALVNRLGFAFDALGMYFLFRHLVASRRDVERLLKGIILLSLPVAAAFLVESRTGRNVFSVFGGVPAITMERFGRLRCQGAFAHPILAGCFWASLMPLFAAGWWEGTRSKLWAVGGLFTSSVIVIACASTTPVLAVILGLAGGAMFPFRRHLRRILLGAFGGLLFLHLLMAKPVWHLLARISLAKGSTGWQRYFLIEQAVRRVGEWWLWGTRSTAHWGQGLQDVTNQYVLEGVRGGLVTLLLFLLLVGLAFRGAGRMWRRTSQDRPAPVFSWALGVALFVHCMNFIAVSYFGQIIVVWYLTLAVIASLDPGPDAEYLPGGGGVSLIPQETAGPWQEGSSVLPGFVAWGKPSEGD